MGKLDFGGMLLIIDGKASLVATNCMIIGRM